jgi:hypothetical protein
MTAPGSSQRLQIPESHKPLLVRLARMPAEQIQGIARALEAQEPPLSRARVTRRIAEEAGIPLSDASSILGLLTSLFMSIEPLGLPSPEAMSASVARSVTAANVGEITEGSEEIATLQRRLSSFLSMQAVLAPLAKGRDLLYTNPNVLLVARIITDVRPVFSAGEIGAPLASVISHTLVLEVRESEEDRNIFVTLDSSDLEDLRQTIERAIAKDSILRKQLSSTTLVPLDLE